MKIKKLLKILLVILCLILALLLILIKIKINKLKNEQTNYKILTSENTIWKVTNQHTDNSSFETIDLPDEILVQIKNKEDFDLAIYNYLNRYEILDASSAELENYERDETSNCIIMNFKLNNNYEDLFAVALYLDNNTMEIIDIWNGEDDWIDEDSSNIDWDNNVQQTE